MTDHPITPPPKLLQQWWDDTYGASHEVDAVATQAARWGADQELEACIKWIRERPCTWTVEQLRAARRPKPPSLQDQALDDLERIATLLMKNKLPCDTGNIRRALESLPD